MSRALLLTQPRPEPRGNRTTRLGYCRSPARGRLKGGPTKPFSGHKSQRRHSLGTWQLPARKDSLACSPLRARVRSLWYACCVCRARGRVFQGVQPCIEYRYLVMKVELEHASLLLFATRTPCFAFWSWRNCRATRYPSYYLSLQGGLKFKALRGKESAVRAPQLPAGCNVEHFSQNGFRTVFCEVMGTLAINFDDI